LGRTPTGAGRKKDPPRNTKDDAVIAIPLGLLAFGRWQLEGEQGHTWIRALPDVVDAMLTRWDLVPDGEAMHGYNGMALPVCRGQEKCVLKVSWPQETSSCEASPGVWTQRLMP
jgi:hypothetical protein